jgi:hypothetical protein
MRVLIGCEESQVVCKAFRKRGHEATEGEDAEGDKKIGFKFIETIIFLPFILAAPIISIMITAYIGVAATVCFVGGMVFTSVYYDKVITILRR